MNNKETKELHETRIFNSEVSMKAIITNSFHNTEATVHVPESGILTASQVRRVRNKLCGCKDCNCGGVLGQRGRQAFAITEMRRGVFVDKPATTPYET